MAFFNGLTASTYKTVLAALRTNALANGWQEGVAVNGGRYVTSTEDEWIATGTGGGADAITVGIRTFSDSLLDLHSWEMAGMDQYTDANTFTAQPGISPGRFDHVTFNSRFGSYVPLANRTMKYWWSVTSRRMCGVIRVGNVYMSFYLGWGMPFDTIGNYPDPKIVAGPTCDYRRRYAEPHVMISGVANPIGNNLAPVTQAGPMQVHNRAGSWETINNARRSNDNTRVSRSQQTARVLFPMGRVNTGTLATPTGADSWIDTTLAGSTFSSDWINICPGSAADTTWPGTKSAILKRTPDPGADEDTVKRFPLIVGNESTIDVELDGMFWCSAAGGPNDPPLQPEDLVTDPVTATDYYAFPMGAHNEEWNYLLLEDK